MCQRWERAASGGVDLRGVTQDVITERVIVVPMKFIICNNDRTKAMIISTCPTIYPLLGEYDMLAGKNEVRKAAICVNDEWQFIQGEKVAPFVCREG